MAVKPPHRSRPPGLSPGRVIHADAENLAIGFGVGVVCFTAAYAALVLAGASDGISVVVGFLVLAFSVVVTQLIFPTMVCPHCGHFNRVWHPGEHRPTDPGE